jgi:hypothetical protein
MKTSRHCLLTPPPPIAQQHSPPYSSPSPMWFIVVSSAVVTHHCGRPQPSLSSSAPAISLPPRLSLYCCAFLLLLPPFSVATASFLASSPLPPLSPSSSYLHSIVFDCCVLLVVSIDCHCVVFLLLLKILTSAGATLLSPHHHLPTLSALALLSI